MSNEFLNKYISTTVLKDLTPLDDCLRTLTDANYFNIELGSTHPYEENVIEILAKYQANYLVHNYFPTPSKDLIVNVCSCDEIIRNKSIDHIEKRIIFSKNIGSKLYTFHPGYISQPISTNKDESNWDFVYLPLINSPSQYDQAYELLIDAIKRFIKIAEEIKQPIALETSGSFTKKDHLLMQKYCEYEKLFSEVDSKYFGINLNLGHLNLASKAFDFDRYEFIESLQEKIFAFEISHNDGVNDDHAMLKAGEWYFEIINNKLFEKIPMIYEGRNTPIVDIKTLWGI